MIVRVREVDIWTFNITDEEYLDLQEGNVDITQILEQKQKENTATWIDGETDYDIIKVKEEKVTDGEV